MAKEKLLRTHQLYGITRAHPRPSCSTVPATARSGGPCRPGPALSLHAGGRPFAAGPACPRAPGRARRDRLELLAEDGLELVDDGLELMAEDGRLDLPPPPIDAADGWPVELPLLLDDMIIGDGASQLCCRFSAASWWAFGRIHGLAQPAAFAAGRWSARDPADAVLSASAPAVGARPAGRADDGRAAGWARPELLAVSRTALPSTSRATHGCCSSSAPPPPRSHNPSGLSFSTITTELPCWIMSRDSVDAESTPRWRGPAAAAAHSAP